MLSDQISRCATLWAGLQPREQRVVAVATGLLGVAILYFVLIDPWWSAQQRLARELPRLRAELATMQAMASTARSLQGKSMASPDVQVVLTALRVDLTHRRLGTETPRLRADGGSKIMVEVTVGDVGALLSWLEKVQKEHRLRVASATMTRTATTAAKAELVLELPGGA